MRSAGPALPLRARPGCTYLAGTPSLGAHRGGAGLAPENTLAAFVPAVEEWESDILEMDVRLSSDGHVMVIHDATVDRTTDGMGHVARMTRDELQALDAGFHFVDQDGDTSWRGRGAQIPTFEEVLEACPDVGLNVETKCEEVAAPLVELVRARGEEHRVLIAAEIESHRRAARGYRGPWGASRRDCISFWLRSRLPGGRRYVPAVDAFQVPERWHGIQVLTPRLVDEAHRRNIAVHVWTVDEAADMRRLLEWGVDGIQSDRIDVLARVLCEVAGRPPPPGLRRADGRGEVVRQR